MSYNAVTKVSSIFEADRQPIYNNLGVDISSAVDSATAIKLAGLDWNIIQSPVQVVDGNVIDGLYANIREDTGDVLGVVTQRYKVCQNTEAFSFVDNLLGNGVHYQTAGCLKDGKRVWMLAKMEDGNDYKLSGDECMPYLMFTGDNTGKGGIRVCCTVTRVWCQNSLNLALKNAQRCWNVTHSGNLQMKLEQARETLNLTSRYLGALKEEVDIQTQIVIDPRFMTNFAQMLFPYKDDDSNIIKSRAEENRANLVGIYENMSDIKKYRGTKYGAVLALSDFASHVAPARNTASFAENRMLSMFTGGQDIESKGMELLNKMC